MSPPNTGILTHKFSIILPHIYALNAQQSILLRLTMIFHTYMEIHVHPLKNYARVFFYTHLVFIWFGLQSIYVHVQSMSSNLFKVVVV